MIGHTLNRTTLVMVDSSDYPWSGNMSEHPPDDPRQPLAFGTTNASEFEAERGPERVLHRRFRTPDWVLDKLRAQASPEDLVADVRDRILNGTTNLHDAQRILNDLGRQGRGGAAFKGRVTQDLLRRLGRR
jgi:hypothetical protein